MANITLPQANIPIGKATCPNCKTAIEVKLEPTWYQQLLKLLKLVNDNL